MYRKTGNTMKTESNLKYCFFLTGALYDFTMLCATKHIPTFLSLSLTTQQALGTYDYNTASLKLNPTQCKSDKSCISYASHPLRIGASLDVLGPPILT